MTPKNRTLLETFYHEVILVLTRWRTCFSVKLDILIKVMFYIADIGFIRRNQKESKMSEKLVVKFKKLHPDAKIPSYAKPGDAGMDMTCVEVTYNEEYGYYAYSVGLAVEIPEGYVGLLFPRSSISNYDMILSNHVGMLDSGYRGNISLRMKVFVENDFIEPVQYKVGDKVGQLMILPYPTIEAVEADELSETVRGTSGYGSSGK